MLLVEINRVRRLNPRAHPSAASLPGPWRWGKFPCPSTAYYSADPFSCPFLAARHPGFHDSHTWASGSPRDHPTTCRCSAHTSSAERGMNNELACLYLEAFEQQRVAFTAQWALHIKTRVSCLSYNSANVVWWGTCWYLWNTSVRITIGNTNICEQVPSKMLWEVGPQWSHAYISNDVKLRLQLWPKYAYEPLLIGLTGCNQCSSSI